MEQNFETILDSLLESYEQNPEKDLNEIINEKCDEIGISEESRQLLKETNEMIDAIEEKTSSLKKAKKEGKQGGVGFLTNWKESQKEGQKKRKPLSFLPYQKPTRK